MAYGCKSWCPIKEIHIEHVNFDTQKMQNPEILESNINKARCKVLKLDNICSISGDESSAYCGKTMFRCKSSILSQKSNGGTNKFQI
ncbi:MAG: RRXRR domain-containing protein [Thiotrichaceae bacterium]